jgi:hypothetical protein
MADDEADESEDAVLSPEELDISDDQHVAELDEGRYLISPDGPAEDADAGSVEVHNHDADSAGSSGADTDSGALDAAAVNEWLDDHVGSSGAAYGFHATACFEGRVARQELYSDDVVTTFENLLTWYVREVGRDTPVEEALGILLLEASVPVQFPTDALESVVEREGLSADDSVADLLAAVERRGGLRLPSRR